MRPFQLALLVASLLFVAGAFAAHPEPDDPHWKEAHMDTAWLRFFAINSSDAGEYTIFFTSDNCYECAPHQAFRGNESEDIRVSSQFGWRISVLRDDLSGSPVPVSVDSVHYHFQEYGHYEMTLKTSLPEGWKATRLVIDNPRPGYFSFAPIITAVSVIVALTVIYKVIAVLYERRKPKPAEDAEPLLATAKHHVKPRLMSLDAFRGISLFFMVFVNYGGGGYWFFEHAAWNGITVADLLFPWFVWIMGAAMPFAFSAAEKKSMSKLRQMLGLLRRAAILFCIGLFLNNGHYINYWRIPGVLQRFAIAYLVVGSLYILMPKIGQRKERPLLAESNDDLAINVNAEFEPRPEAKGSNLPSCFHDHFGDIFPFLFEYALVGLLVLMWFLLTFFLPVPGCPTGYIGPGGRSGNAKCTGGAAGHIDRVIFSLNHIYHHPTCSEDGPGDIPQNYGCEAYDPEGLLGNLTSIFLCYLGLQAGRIMKTYQTHRARFLRLLIHGVIWAGIGTGLCGASQNDGILPLNKNLWSFSFVAVLGGLAYLLLAVCFVLIDWLRIWRGGPFTYVGMNSLVVYCCHDLLGDYFPFSWSWRQPNTEEGQYRSHWTETASNLCGACLWALIAFILFKKKIFIRV